MLDTALVLKTSLIIDIVEGSGRQTQKGKKQQRQEKNQNIRIEHLEKKKKAWLSSIMSW